MKTNLKAFIFVAHYYLLLKVETYKTCLKTYVKILELKSNLKLQELMPICRGEVKPYFSLNQLNPVQK